MTDLAALDQERAVARQPRRDDALRIEHAVVPEPRDEQPALHLRDERVEIETLAIHVDVARPRYRRNAGELRIAARRVQHLQYTAIDPRRARVRAAVLGERRRRVAAIARIGAQRHARIEQLIAELRATTGLREEAPPLVRRACVHAIDE